MKNIWICLLLLFSVSGFAKVEKQVKIQKIPAKEAFQENARKNFTKNAIYGFCH